jgi:hypothetical protein
MPMASVVEKEAAFIFKIICGILQNGWTKAERTSSAV